MSCELLTLKATAARLGMSVGTVRRIANDERESLPVVVVRGRRRFPAGALDRWIADKQQAQEDRKEKTA